MSYFLQVDQSHYDSLVSSVTLPWKKQNVLILFFIIYSKWKLAQSIFGSFLKSFFIHSLTDYSACQMEAEWRSPRELSPHNDRYSTKGCLLMVVLGAFWLVGHHSQTTSSQTGNSSSEGKFHYNLILYQWNWCFSKGKSETYVLWLYQIHESNLVVYFYLLISGSK